MTNKIPHDISLEYKELNKWDATRDTMAFMAFLNCCILIIFNLLCPTCLVKTVITVIYTLTLMGEVFFTVLATLHICFDKNKEE